MYTGFDPTQYTRSPIFDVPGGLALAWKLIVAAPKKARGKLQSALTRLVASHKTLQGAHDARELVLTRAPSQPIHILVGVAWKALQQRVEAYATLSSDLYPLVTQANQLLVAIFYDGLEFTQQPYPAEWIECDKRIRLIDEQGLTAAVQIVAGKEFLDEVERVHLLFGDALGMKTPLDIPTVAPDLAKPRQELSAAIGAYGIQLVAMAEDATPKEEKIIRTALQPIDEFRAAQAAAAAGGTSNGGTTSGTPPDVKLDSDKKAQTTLEKPSASANDAKTDPEQKKKVA